MYSSLRPAPWNRASAAAAVSPEMPNFHATAHAASAKLERDLLESKALDSAAEMSCFYRDVIIPDMNELRITVDSMETICGSDAWPYPSYGDMLFSIK